MSCSHPKPEGFIQCRDCALHDAMLRIRVQRYRFLQDDDGHWYKIPADKVEAFQLWLRIWDYPVDDTRYGSWVGKDFSDYRLSGGPESWTFVDAKEDV